MSATECYGIMAPEAAAATAMVTVVRLILVILICGLLIRLSAKGNGSGKKSKEVSAAGEVCEYAQCYAHYQTRNHQNYTTSSSATTTTSKSTPTSLKQNGSQKNESIKKEDQETNLQYETSPQDHHHQQQHHHQQHLRRKSEPELHLKQQQEEENLKHQKAERQRRHSDTCLAQLKLPPGPTGLPFLGYMPFVGNEIHLTLTSLSERYGPIYQIWLGGIRVVVLNDASLVRQAFKQPVFSGRPDTQLTRILQGYGIVNSEGALWREQRAFLHSALRKLGAKSLMSGSNGLEAKIQNQVKEFVNDLSVHAEGGKACQVRPMVARAVSSVVGSIVMNLTYRKYEEKEKFDRLIELMQEGFRLFTIAMPLDFIPICKFFPGVSYAYKKMKKNRAETSAFFQNVADEHRKYLSETFNVGTTSTASSLHPRNTTSEPSPAPSPAPAAPQTSTTTSTSTTTTTSTTGSEGLTSSSPPPSSTSSSSSSRQPRQGQEQQQDERLLMKREAVVATAALTAQEEEQCKQQQQHEHELEQQQKKRQQDELQQQAPIKAAAAAAHQKHTQSFRAEQQQQQQQQQPELENIVARDLVDAYLLQQKKHEKDGKENYFSDQQLIQCMSDIFSAGLETVTSTIEWSILFLILNTECQEQIQCEIDKVIGRSRLPQLEDLSHMPYTEATIYEVLRRSNVVALGNAHVTLDDASIGGYRIPRGTQVLPNLYGIHMNPKLWHEPDRFNPSRFIVNERAKKPDYFIPFSVGRRMCLGDVLAKMEVFLFLVGLLQKYDLAVAEEDRHSPPQVKGTLGAANTPASFKVALTCRPVNGTTGNNNSSNNNMNINNDSQESTTKTSNC